MSGYLTTPRGFRIEGVEIKVQRQFSRKVEPFEHYSARTLREFPAQPVYKRDGTLAKRQPPPHPAGTLCKGRVWAEGTMVLSFGHGKGRFCEDAVEGVDLVFVDDA